MRHFYICFTQVHYKYFRDKVFHAAMDEKATILQGLLFLS